MNAPAKIPRKLTVDEFIAAYSGREEKYELVDGEPRMMAGANRRHARLTRNLIVALGSALRGGPCEVMPGDMGLEVSDYDYRLPDVAIYCDPRDLGPVDDEPTRLRYPKVVIEVLSRSTSSTDYGVKLSEYQLLPSVDTIVYVNPAKEIITTFERAGDNEWHVVVHLPGQPLVLRDPAVTVTADEVFAGVG